jgi:hypothetical protein
MEENGTGLRLKKLEEGGTHLYVGFFRLLRTGT